MTPLLFASLLVGTAGVDAVPAAVLAAASAWLVIAFIDRRQAVAQPLAEEHEPATATG